MEIKIDELLNKILHLAPIYSKKFYISEDGAKKFLKLAIIYIARTDFKLKVEDNVILGDDVNLNKFKQYVLNWNENEFDEEDFEIIGYCQNIR